MEESFNYNFVKEESTIVGIDIDSFFTISEIKSISLNFLFMKKNLKDKFHLFINTINSIKNNNNKLYFITENISKKYLLSLERILSNYNIEGSFINYEDSIVSVSREFRFDILVTKKEKIDYNKFDYITKKVFPNKGDNISKYIPEYMQLILLENKFEKQIKENVSYIEHLYQLASQIEICKNNIKKRTQTIYKSFEYTPKTGIVSIDKEYKKYWQASKFEGNIFDEITQKMSKFEFIKYHNRYSEDEEIIYVLDGGLEIKITKGERDILVEKACKSFLNLGIKKGDVVTMCSVNSISDYILSLALNHIGAIVNPIHPLATTAKIERFVNEVKPKFFIYFDLESDEEFVDLDYLINKYNIEKIIKLTPVDLANLVVKKIYLKKIAKKIKKDEYHSRFRISDESKQISFDEFIKIGETYKGKIESNFESTDTAYYYSTGGTTSERPSIVDLPYSMLNLCYYNSYGINIEKGDAVFINYPRYIAFSDENCTHLPDSVGMKMIMTPYEYPKDFAQILQKYKIKVMQMAPQFYEMMLDDEKKGSFNNIDLSNVRYIVAGGDKMDNSLKKRILDFFARHNNTDVQIIIGYGCTEVSGSSMVQLFDTNRNKDEGNIGILLPTFDAKLVDEYNNEVVDKEQKGRLLVGGKGYIMNGYLNDEDATKKVIVTDVDGKKWYDTADIIEFRPDENVDNRIPNAVGNFITREKRFVMITRENTSGKAIPDDIEKLIVDSLPEVKQCCVVGIKENDEMVLKAAITMEDGFIFDEELISKIKLLASSKDALYSISEVKLIEKMPLTDRQKIKYRDIEEMFNNEIKIKRI